MEDELGVGGEEEEAGGTKDSGDTEGRGFRLAELFLPTCAEEGAGFEPEEGLLSKHST